MFVKQLVPQQTSGLGGKLPSQNEFMTPMTIESDKFRPLRADLIFDARENPMDTHSLFSFLPTYDLAGDNLPCIGATDLAGIVNKRIKERNPVPDTDGIYPQPLPSRDKFFGLAHTRCDIENSDNKVLRSYNNFNPLMKPPFEEFKR